MASSETPFRLDGETALITGGGTGLGLAIADCFVRSGARVILTGRTEDVLREAVGKLGPAADYRVHDVAEDDRVPALLESLDSPPSILVNNAGIHLKKPAALTTGEEFAEVLRVHVLGAFAFTRHLIPSMQSRGSGSILFIASMASIIGLPETVAYSAAKSAYAGMTRSLASELGGSGIRVNAIAPGWIETPCSNAPCKTTPPERRKSSPALRLVDSESLTISDGPPFSSAPQPPGLSPARSSPWTEALPSDSENETLLEF